MIQNHRNKISDEQIRDIYETDITLHEAASLLKMTTVTLWRRAKKLGLSWSDKPAKRPYNKIDLNEILKGNYPAYQTFKLKNRLVEVGIKKNKCEECGISEWNGKPLNMILDHIDGNPHNHKLENLRMLCPNCDSQMDTFCGKNKAGG